ncbi:MAG: cysteine protease [Pleopsidium flavum]|nr:MAG: cysteine protease [Pleopsidium flavum]
MGTGKLTEKEEGALGLAGEHDFAVLDMREIGEHRLVLVKNPWAKGTIWKGLLPGSDKVELVDGAEDQEISSQHLGENLRDADPLKPGTFWMDLNNVFQSFESIYLNWNPGLFSYRQDIHFSWDLTNYHSAAGCFFSNPQYAVSTRSGGTVWLLLSRHFKTVQCSGNMDLHSSDNEIQHDVGFISLYAFEKIGQRVFRSDGALHRGPYVDSPNTLLRLDMAQNVDYTIVVSEQSLPHSKHNFTLSAFSLKPVSIALAAEKYTFRTKHEGAWTGSTAGGNANSASYFTNPQFSLHLSAPSDIALLIETNIEDLPVNVKLVWAGGNRVTGVTTRDIAGESGEYRHGCALAEIRNIHAGVYTVVCSTFEPGQIGRFVLRVGTMVDCVVKPIPSEGAGRLRPWLPPASFSPGINKMLAPLVIQRITRLKMTASHQLQSAGQSAHAPSPLKASLEVGQGPYKQVLAVSANDSFSDSPAGVRIPDTDVLPQMHGKGGLWLVIERLGGSSTERDEKVDVELFSEGPVNIGRWGSGTG